MTVTDTNPAPDSPADSAAATCCAHPSSGTPRRSLLYQGLTALISTVIVAIPASLGGLFFLDPILRRPKSGSGGQAGGAARKDENGFIRLDVTREAVPADGTPVSVTVYDDIEDAWNRFPNVPVGSIWLRKVGDGPILAFNSICPHLGCSVNYRRAENDFFCPCHTSAFALDGKKSNEVPPRDMDALDVAMRTGGKDDPAGSEIWVKFQNFRRATSERIPI
ncbi:MAG: ubiquinol-cytochrome c reductase iron-sulfur subunit [Planctomycetaceae bacterium]